MKKLQRPLGILALLALVTAFVLWMQEPPTPVAASAPADVFSAERAMVHVHQIARTPHPPGTPEHDRVRDYLVAELTKLGFTTTVQKRIAHRDEHDGALRLASVENIVAERHGTAPTGTLLLAAHYDSHLSGPGAGDDAAGVAALLEAMRALGSGAAKNTLRVLITDAEEFGLLGAQGYVDSLTEKPEKSPTLVLNFEARGGGGPVFMFETSEFNKELIEQFAHACPHPHASSLMYALYETLPNDTDLTIFKKVGMMGLNFAFVGRWQSYHSALDTPENLDTRSLQQHGASALALSRAFLETDLMSLDSKRKQNAIYFDVLGQWVLHYPTYMAWVYSGYVGIFFLALLWRNRQEKDATKAFFAGLGLGLGTLVTGALVAVLVGFAVQPFRQSVPNRDPYGVRWFEAALLLATLAFIWLEWGPVLRRFSGKQLSLGALCWWVLALIATNLFLPGASYLFLWPLLFSLIGIAWGKPWLAAVPLLVFLAPVWHSLALLLGFGLPPFLGVLATFGLLPLLPLVRDTVKPLVLLPPAVFLLSGVVCFVIGALQTGPRTSALLYLEDADTGKAQWVSLQKPNVWTKAVLGERPTETKLGDFPAFAAPTPSLKLPAQTITHQGQSITITLPERATELMLTFDKPTTLTLDGKKLPALTKLRWFGPPQTATLSAEASAETTLTVDMVLPGLPPNTPPRPEGWIPVSVDSYTDVRIVRRTLRIGYK
ncbi:M20/M25/M40 family metallo-hydrolase [Armatimonas sp.]|uniref:M20/M25/M40 family metallo-hydrolase n=1 Tax=Armatimonas sp. TaxID=1872638 RepID=UPI00286A753C|nr:M20/M25/M40 family metallo-hydrolase [Armatimonas sp.]